MNHTISPFEYKSVRLLYFLFSLWSWLSVWDYVVLSWQLQAFDNPGSYLTSLDDTTFSDATKREATKDTESQFARSWRFRRISQLPRRMAMSRLKCLCLHRQPTRPLCCRSRLRIDKANGSFQRNLPIVFFQKSSPTIYGELNVKRRSCEASENTMFLEDVIGIL